MKLGDFGRTGNWLVLLGGSATGLGYPNPKNFGYFGLKRTKKARGLGHPGRQIGTKMGDFFLLWPPAYLHNAYPASSWCPAMYLSPPGMFRVQIYVLEPRNVAFWANEYPSKNPSRARLLAVFAITVHRQRKALKSYVRICISPFCLTLKIGPTVALQKNFNPRKTTCVFFDSLF